MLFILKIDIINRYMVRQNICEISNDISNLKNLEIL